MNIFRLAAELFLIYILYKIIFEFIVPVYNSTKKIKKQFGDIIEGILASVAEDEIVLEEKAGKGKKTPDSYREKTTPIFFNQIKHTKVLITF